MTLPASRGIPMEPLPLTAIGAALFSAALFAFVLDAVTILMFPRFPVG